MSYRAAFILFCLCFSTSKPGFGLDLKNLDDLSPEQEAEIAASGDHVFFVGVWGYSLMTLDVPGNPYCWSDSGMVKKVPGTGDALVDVRWQSVAERFSSIFNKKMLELRPELNEHACAQTP